MDQRVQVIIDELGLKDIQYLGKELKKWELLHSSNLKTPLKASLLNDIVKKIKELIILKALEISSYSLPSMALSFEDSEKMLSRLHDVSIEKARLSLEKFGGDILKASEELDDDVVIVPTQDSVMLKSLVYECPLPPPAIQDEEEEEDDTTENGELLSEEAVTAMRMRYGQSIDGLLKEISLQESSSPYVMDEAFEEEFQAFVNQRTPTLKSPQQQLALIEN